MRFKKRRLAREVVLAAVILAVGFVVGFGSIYLAELLSGAATESARAKSDQAVVEEQVTSLLEQLGELIEQYDSILVRERLGLFDTQRLESLRSQLYLLHLDLTHLLLENRHLSSFVW